MEYENLNKVFGALNRIVQELKIKNRLCVLLVKDEYFILILLLLCYQKKTKEKFEIGDCILIKENNSVTEYVKAVITDKEIMYSEVFIKYKTQISKNEKNERKNSVVINSKKITDMEKNAVVVRHIDKTTWLNSRVRREDNFNNLYKIEFPIIIGNSILYKINKLKDRLADYKEFIDLISFIDSLNTSKYLNIFRNKEIQVGPEMVYLNTIPLNIINSKIVIMSVFNHNFDYNIFLLNELVKKNNFKLLEDERGFYTNNMMEVKVYGHS